MLAPLLFGVLALTPLDGPGYRNLLRANHGHVLLVAFWATWCEPCREELPLLRDLARRSHGRARLITVSADEPEQSAAAGDFLKIQRIGRPAYRIKSPTTIDSVDSTWSGALPALFVYRADGALKTKYFGDVDWPALERLVSLTR